MRLSKKQVRAMTWWMPKSRDKGFDALVCDGAVRSGKTLAMGLGFFLWAMSCFSGRRFALCGKTRGGVRRNVVQELLPWLQRLGMRVSERRAEGVLTVSFGKRENDFYLFGGKDEGSAALIQGMTLAGVFLDEVVLMPRSFVEQACARCSVEGSRLWFSCNPEGPQHWFYREWILQADRRDCLREMDLYVWDPSAGGERVVKKNDHAMDDMRYFVTGVLAGGTGFYACAPERRFE